VNVLVVYATNSSGTQEAAHLVRDTLTGEGHTVDCRRVYHVHPTELGSFDLVVLGSCTWDNMVEGKRVEGQLQQHMQQFADQLTDGQYAGSRFAVFGLGDSSYNRFCAAADHLEKLVGRIGGAQVGETLRIDGYFFNPERNRAAVANWARALR
jgi:flavodoxin I